jgi:hypothetical protein
MKHTKFVAGLGTAVLAAGSLALGLNVSPAQAATGGPFTLTGSPQNQASPTVSSYGGKPTIELTAVPSGTDVIVKAAISVGPTTPAFAGFAAGSYRLDAYVRIDNGPQLQLTGTNPAANPAVGTNSVSFPGGTTATATVSDLAQGPHTIVLQSVVVESNGAQSGGAFSTNFSQIVGFDAVYNLGGTPAAVLANPPSKPIGLTQEVVAECNPAKAATTSTKLTASPAGSTTVGASVTLSATVTAKNCAGDALAPVGKIQFKDGTTNLGGSQNFTGAAVTYSTSSLAAGSHNLTAEFTPDVTSDPDGFRSSKSTLAYSIKAKPTAKPTPKPTPSETEPTSTGVDDAPRSDSATVTAYCDVASGIPGAKAEYKFPLKITVSPGAAAPGSAVNVSVAVNKSPINNGPTDIGAGEYRMEATVGFQGDSIQLIGPDTTSVAPTKVGLLYKANELPIVAKGSVTLPKKEGEFPITVKDIWFNNQNNEPTGTVGDLDDSFDQRCNASSDPVKSPKAFAAPVVEVESNENAEVTDIEPPVAGGPALAATGPAETLALGLLALVILQFGAIMTVRAYRSAPRRARH